MVPVLAVILLVGVFVFAACIRRRGIPAAAWRALTHADRYELFSLEPYLVNPYTYDPSAPRFEGRQIIGSTLVADATTRQRLNLALESGAQASDGKMGACFNPRHGIRVTASGVTTDFVICFECRQVQVWRGGKEIGFFLTSSSPQPVFDEVLRKAGVPLAAKAP